MSRLFGGVRARVMEVLLGIEGGATVRQIARIADLAPSSASVALRSLEQVGLVKANPTGAALVYEANMAHIAYDALHQIIERTGTAEQELVERLAGAIGDRPRAVILFGSVARGDDSPESDVDILVLLKTRAKADLFTERGNEISEHLSKWLGRHVHLVIAGPPGAEDLKRSFWRDIRRDGRVLAGDRISDLLRAG